MMHLLLLN